MTWVYSSQNQNMIFWVWTPDHDGVWWDKHACIFKHLRITLKCYKTECQWNHPSGFLPGTTSYVYVRCRTYTLRHRTSDVRCRVQHRTYDIVRTILHTILHVRHRTFVNIVGATYDIVRPTYDIVGSGKSMSYTMSYVSQNLRCRTFENVYRIRCRRCLSYTMSYVFAQTYDVVCFIRYRIFLLFRPKPTIS